LFNTPISVPGRTGAVDYSVFLAIVCLAWFLNRIKLYLPVREIALLSACDKNTISESLRRLVNLGLITPIHSIESNGSIQVKYSLDSPLLDSLAIYVKWTQKLRQKNSIA
jgi:hypothetical protein